MSQKKLLVTPCSPISTHRTTKCSYCKRPVVKRVTAAGKLFCGKVCAVLGLTRLLGPEDIAEDFAGDLEDLVTSAYHDENPRIPVRVRYSDALDYDYASPEDWVVVVDDDQIPDWRPDPMPRTGKVLAFR